MLSIIIPTYNRKDLLSQCLDSLHPNIQNVNLNSYEVIVTDDSTNEDTRDLIKNQYNWVQWVVGPKRGPASNRNNGAKHAKGEWLVFLDDDCLPDQYILHNYNKVISDNLGTSVIEGLIYSDDIIMPLFTAPVNLAGGNLWSCNFAIQKDLFQKINGFDENYRFPNLEDTDLYKRVKDKYPVFFSKEAKVYHPPRPVVSPKKAAKLHESWFYFYNKFGQKKTLYDLLKTIIQTRIGSIKSQPLTADTAKAIFSLFAELFYTIRNSKLWQKNGLIK